jgi:tRNA 2-thiouridine synthesizing protein A
MMMDVNQEPPIQRLSLTTVKCPLNFVKARLALEKLLPGALLDIVVAHDSESAMNVPRSLTQEGHVILKQDVLVTPEEGEVLVLRVRRKET